VFGEYGAERVRESGMPGFVWELSKDLELALGISTSCRI